MQRCFYLHHKIKIIFKLWVLVTGAGLASPAVAVRLQCERVDKTRARVTVSDYKQDFYYSVSLRRSVKTTDQVDLFFLEPKKRSVAHTTSKGFIGAQKEVLVIKILGYENLKKMEDLELSCEVPSDPEDEVGRWARAEGVKMLEIEQKRYLTLKRYALGLQQGLEDGRKGKGDSWTWWGGSKAELKNLAAEAYSRAHAEAMSKAEALWRDAAGKAGRESGAERATELHRKVARGELNEFELDRHVRQIEVPEWVRGDELVINNPYSGRLEKELVQVEAEIEREIRGVMMGKFSYQGENARTWCEKWQISETKSPRQWKRALARIEVPRWEKAFEIWRDEVTSWTDQSRYYALSKSQRKNFDREFKSAYRSGESALKQIAAKRDENAYREGKSYGKRLRQLEMTLSSAAKGYADGLATVPAARAEQEEFVKEFRGAVTNRHRYLNAHDLIEFENITASMDFSDPEGLILGGTMLNLGARDGLRQPVRMQLRGLPLELTELSCTARGAGKPARGVHLTAQHGGAEISVSVGGHSVHEVECTGQLALVDSKQFPELPWQGRLEITVENVAVAEVQGLQVTLDQVARRYIRQDDPTKVSEVMRGLLVSTIDQEWRGMCSWWVKNTYESSTSGLKSLVGVVESEAASLSAPETQQRIRLLAQDLRKIPRPWKFWCPHKNASFLKWVDRLAGFAAPY